MKYRALIVEDVADIAETVIETLESMGHEYLWVKSQEEARQPVADGGFSYVLMDLSIPLKTGRSLDRIEYGVNLAKEIHQSSAMHNVPLIVMTGHGRDGIEYAANLCQYGVVDFINKPFPTTGRTLAQVIETQLTKATQKSTTTDTVQSKPDKPFQGGELVIYPDHAELCGINIINHKKASQMWAILIILTEQLPSGKFKAFPSATLAKLVRSTGGQNSITGSIRDFRKNITTILGNELGLLVGNEDIVETARSGYRLKSWIKLKDQRGQLACDQSDVFNPATGKCKDPVENRKSKILAVIQSNPTLRIPGIANATGMSQATTKRVIETLKAEGKVEFVGPTKTGCYTLAKS
jgi:CheY-like chemotaxis protein